MPSGVTRVGRAAWPLLRPCFVGVRHPVTVSGTKALCTAVDKSARLARVRAENQVFEALRKIEGIPDLVARGMIQKFSADIETGMVSFALQPTVGGIGDGEPDGPTIQQLCEAQVMQVPWAKYVEVSLLPPKPASKSRKPGEQGAKPKGLANVKNIIAVSSCKGGVGKSTTAVNLSTALSQLGFQVGIFDADVYGPSLPTMAGIPSGAGLYADEAVPELIAPIIGHGNQTMKLMSYGFAKDSAAVMRGPMVGSLVNQLITQTAWGELDYLVVDMPPGTGDIQLSLCQTVNFDASVVVTTPQQISLVDVVKGVQMFQKLNVPTVAVVENMAHFDCDLGTRYYPFGKGSRQALVDQYGFPVSISLPIEPLLSLYSDIGRPMTAQDQNSEIADTFRNLAFQVDEEVVKLAKTRGKPPVVQICDRSNMIQGESGGVRYESTPFDLRLQCKCAACVDEMTGAQRIVPEDIPANICATKIEPKGNYAVEITWGDGHQSIFPYTMFFGQN